MGNDKDMPIEELCRALRRDHPLRAQVREVLFDSNARIEEVEPVLRALVRPSRVHRQERVVAAWLIEHASWSDAQRSKLSATLSLAVDKAMQAQGRQRTLRRWFRRGMAVSFGVCLGYVLLGMYRLLPENVRSDAFYSDGITFCLLTLTLVVAGTILGWCGNLSFSSLIDQQRLRRLRPVVEALGELGQPGCLASIGAASTFDPLQDVATSALARVTAALRPEDYGTLPLRSVSALCDALTTGSPETAPVILQALEVIGNGHAIQSVTQLAATDIRPDVREAATRLLPILHRRDQESKAAALLLRASVAPPEEGSTLLRPVREQPTTDPAQLLRATAGSQDHTE